MPGSAANESGNASATKTNSFTMLSDIHDAARQRQRLGPQSSGRSEPAGGSGHALDKLIDLHARNHKRRSGFQDDKVIPADLSQALRLAEHPPHQHLPKCGRMNFLKRLEIEPQIELARRLKFNAVHQPDPTNI